MASRDNLVATPTVDRNGRATTVYRRQGAGTADAKRIPSPQIISSGEDRMELTREVSLKLLGDAIIPAADRRAIVENLHTYSDEMLKKILKTVSAEENAQQGKRRLDKLHVKIARGATEDSINEALFFYPLTEDSGAVASNRLIDSLSHYPQLPESDDYSREDPVTVERCTALIRVADALSYLTGDVLNPEWVITDQRLTQLVLANPGRGEQIAGIIKERQSVDVDLIESIIGGDSAALDDGRL